MRLKANPDSRQLRFIPHLVITLIVLRLCVSQQVFATEANNSPQPNIVFILADDMGVGEVSHNGGLIPTPALDRMAAVDRAALRIGTWEIVWNDEVPDGVAVSEAVNLVQNLSTDDSPGFVNGLLSRIAEVKDTLA